MRPGVRTAFDYQIDSCRRLGSPFTQRLLTLARNRLAPDGAVARRVLDCPGDPAADALPLRVAGGLHALVLQGAAGRLAALYPPHPPAADDDDLWQAVLAAFDEHEAFLTGFLDSPPQTNEVARSAALLGGFLTVARETGRPLAILEIGASAGLNLHWDRYRYRLGAAAWGDAASGVAIEPDWQGAPAPLHPATVTERAGCDLRPADPGDAGDRLRLTAYVWADQTARLERLRAALALAAASTVRVEQADAADWIERRLANRPEGAATVVFHSVMWQYMPAGTQARIRDCIEATGRAAAPSEPLAWLSMERAPGLVGAEVRLRLWPGGRDARLGEADYHGRWVRWEACE